jgi:1-acyl-sn-glycerol-3-phosphate acyltransferase
MTPRPPDLFGPRANYGGGYPLTYRILWILLVPLIRLYWRVTPEHLERVPRAGGFILATNHWSGVDPIMLCAIFWRPVHWLAKIELVKSLKVAWFFRAAAVIPVNRDAPEHEWIERTGSLLRRGAIFGIFPEGTRSVDGRMYKGYTGVGRVAAESGVPVVPAAVMGTRESVPKGKLIPRPRRVTVRFGEPLRFDIRPGEDEKSAFRRFTDDVMHAIRELSGQEYVDEYNRRERKR